jgi:precorrin-4 methylase
MKTLVTQRMKTDEVDDYSLAEKYYNILSAVNNMHLTQREIQLIAFTAVKGNMTFANHREEFCRIYSTTSPTINNIISKLKKLGILIKEGGKVKVVPVIALNFANNVTLEIKLTHNEVLQAVIEKG